MKSKMTDWIQLWRVIEQLTRAVAKKRPHGVVVRITDTVHRTTSAAFLQRLEAMDGYTSALTVGADEVDDCAAQLKRVQTDGISAFWTPLLRMGGHGKESTP